MNMTLNSETGDVLNGDNVIGRYDATTKTFLAAKRPAPTHYKPLKELLGEDVKIEVAPESAIPSEPEKDPQHGDKTPEWARWLRDTNPEAFEKRFAGRKLILD